MKIIFWNYFFRSKSRSVDHGFSTPYDLESLRSKVEGRFESVDKLSRGKYIMKYFDIFKDFDGKIKFLRWRIL